MTTPVPSAHRARGWFSRLLLGTAAAGAAGLAWSLAEAQAFTVRRVEIPALPPGTGPLRVLHISDLHLRPGQHRKIAWLRRLAELDPDLVINTGDNMADPMALPAVLRALEPLLDVPGVFVMGSNDYFSPQLKNPARYLRRDARGDLNEQRPEDVPGHELARAFAASRWLDLTNRTGTLERRGLALEFVGVDDPHLERDLLPQDWAPGVGAGAPSEGAGVPGDGAVAPGREPGSPGAGSAMSPGASAEAGAAVAAGAFSTADGSMGEGASAEAGARGGSTRAESPSGLRIGVAHAPYLRTLAGMQALGCQVVFAGHTHGGQLCVPGYGALVTNCDLDRERASGLHGWPGESGSEPDSLWLHVSNGIGTSPFTPVRFACRPSVTLVTLTTR